MILTSRPSLQSLPESIILTTTIMALLFSVTYLVYFLGRSPLLLVRGAKTYIPQAQPAFINESYVDGFSRLFIERYASWNVYNFRANRNHALQMISADLGDAVAAEGQATARIVSMLQNSRQIRIDQVDIKTISFQCWSVSAVVQQANFDGGVERDRLFRRFDLVVRGIEPNAEVPYCLEVVTFSDRLLTAEELAALPLPLPSSPQNSRATHVDDWTLPSPSSAPLLTPGTTP